MDNRNGKISALTELFIHSRAAATEITHAGLKLQIAETKPFFPFLLMFSSSSNDKLKGTSMLVPQVSAELMIIAQSVAKKSGRTDIINTMLKEHTMFGFDAVYAATQRLYAFAHALANTDAFDYWISPPEPGKIYSEINPAVWHAVATAPLERVEEDLYTQARFDVEQIRRSVRLAS